MPGDLDDETATSGTAEAARDQTRGGTRRFVIASLFGNALEWYDFFLYATAASLVFGKLFFPAGTAPLVATLGAFVGFAVGFAARPLGGFIFGHLGDRVSRKGTLLVTLVLMGSATFLIGTLPTYAQVGVWAPVLLVVLRIVQGIAAGGEWSGAVLLISENSSSRRRGTFSALSQSGLAIGFVLSTAVFYVVSQMPQPQLLDWGWRVPFLLSAVIFGLGVYIRHRLPNQDAVTDARDRGTVERLPIIAAIREYPRAILVGMGLRMAENGGSYLFLSFSLVYGNYIGIDTGLLLVGLAVSMTAAAFTMPCFGFLSDVLGRRPVYAFGALGLAAVAFPFFWLLDQQTPASVILALFFGNGVFHAAMIGTQPAYYHELFRPEVRYSAMSMSHEVASIFAGGISPLIATALLQQYGSSAPVSLYAIGLAAVTLAALAMSPRVHSRSREGGAPRGIPSRGLTRIATSGRDYPPRF